MPLTHAQKKTDLQTTIHTPFGTAYINLCSWWPWMKPEAVTAAVGADANDSRSAQGDSSLKSWMRNQIDSREGEGLEAASLQCRCSERNQQQQWHMGMSCVSVYAHYYVLGVLLWSANVKAQRRGIRDLRERKQRWCVCVYRLTRSGFDFGSGWNKNRSGCIFQPVQIS